MRSLTGIPQSPRGAAVEPDAVVFAVHTTRPDEGAGAIEVIFTAERSARSYARSRSNDWRITSASVTRYTPRPARHATSGRLVPARRRAGHPSEPAGSPVLPDRPSVCSSRRQAGPEYIVRALSGCPLPVQRDGCNLCLSSLSRGACADWHCLICPGPRIGLGHSDATQPESAAASARSPHGSRHLYAAYERCRLERPEQRLSLQTLHCRDCSLSC